MEGKSASELIKNAKAEIENLTPRQVLDEITFSGATLIDIRESEELSQNGKISQSHHASRGMLEFYADASLPYYRPVFDKSKRIILHCASGGRSALAVTTLKQMGYKNVAHLDGGLNAWKDSGLPTE